MVCKTGKIIFHTVEKTGRNFPWYVKPAKAFSIPWKTRRAKARIAFRRRPWNLVGMATNPVWQWDETEPVARDFGDRQVVAAYDEQHRRYRDVDGEIAAVLARLDLKPGQVAGDFGCGTGAFARAFARRCRTVYAVDVSAAMLDYLAWQAKEEGLANVVCRPGGFLSYVHDGPPLDALHTSLALHHLPDFWKQKALDRLAGMIRAGGKFHLMDVAFVAENCDANIAAWIARTEARTTVEMADALRQHVRREYSTYTWILEGMLARAGLRIDHAEHPEGVIAHYYCTKAM